MSVVENKLSFIQKSLDMGEYDVVVKECSTLFEIAFRRIFSEAIISFPFKERTELQECEKRIGKNTKGIQDFTFGELVGLFRETGLMNKWARYSSKDIGLMTSLDFGPIVSLRNSIVHEGGTCSRYEAELIYNYLRNLLASLGLSDLSASVTNTLSRSEKVHASENDTAGQTKVFKYLHDRGLIINPSDNSRNISFKVETLNRIFDVIYREISLLNDEPEAQRVLWKAGYESGKNFGAIMNDKWELEQEVVSINDKIGCWCEFDSDVGWGRFINNLRVDEEEGLIEGQLIISENFLTYNRKKEDSQLCSFIKGYSEGVLEQLMRGVNVEVICDPGSCPLKNAFKKQCTLSLQVKGNS